MSKPTECTKPRINPDVNCGCWVMMVCQRVFITCNCAWFVETLIAGRLYMWEEGGPGNSCTLCSVLLWTLNCSLKKSQLKTKQTNKQVTFKKPEKIIWVFSKKKDAQSDLSFSLMYQYPAEDPVKSSCLWRVVPKEEEAVATGQGWGWRQAEINSLFPAAKGATAPGEMLSWSDLCQLPYAKHWRRKPSCTKWLDHTVNALSKTVGRGGWLWLFLLLIRSQLAVVKRHLRWESLTEKRL